MQAAAYIFIHRKWKDDKSHFEDMIDYFCDIREPLQLLLFPEGTDLTGKVAWAWITELHNMKGKWKWSRSVVSDSWTLCHPMDCSLPGSSVHGIFQAIVLEWIAISFFNMKVLWNQLSSLNFSVLRHWTLVRLMAHPWSHSVGTSEPRTPDVQPIEFIIGNSKK